MAQTGLPYIHYWDEPTYLKLSLQMMRDGDFNPGWRRIPPFFLYQHTAVQSLRYLEKARDGRLDPLKDERFDHWNRELRDSSVLTWSRRYTAILGALICVMAYLLVRRILPESIALLTGLILAVLHGHIENSSVVTSDIPMAFMVLLTVLLCFTWRQFGVLQCFWLGFFPGLAAATKYPGGAVLVVPVVFMLLQKKRNPVGFLHLPLGVLVGFTVGYPYWFLRYPKFLTGVAEELHHYNWAVVEQGLYHHWGIAFLVYLAVTGLGLGFSVMALIGLYESFARIGKRDAIRLFSFPCVYALWLLSQPASFVRNLTSLLPWFAMFAAAGVVFLWQRSGAWSSRRRRRAGRSAVIAALVLSTAYPTGFWLWRVACDDEPRVAMVDCVREETPDDAVIGIPADMHFLYTELARMGRPIVLLGQSDLHRQTQTDLDYLVGGQKPMAFGPWDKAGYQAYIENAAVVATSARCPAYAPYSIFSLFYEGRWYVNGHSMNPALLLVRSTNSPEWVWLDLSDDSYQVIHSRGKSPIVGQTFDGHTLAVGRLEYSTGMCVTLGTVLSFPVPEGAERFVVDFGFPRKVKRFTRLPYRVQIKTREDRVYFVHIPPSEAAVCRADVPVDPGGEVIVHVLDEMGMPDVQVMLGRCSFAIPKRR